ncbi:MAG TPA: YifB family Mg chelatase-like AAA ATPase [Candidatus Dormibacteraeota bacterium]|nr:YifB family Mg chelatase-like AAA ATPase [Candidatus Dormibacteraeota bacterium]
MPAKVLAPTCIGVKGQLIDVECDLASGLPSFTVVGLGDKAVAEAKDRVRSAIKNSGLFLPPKRITLNLAPADLPKDGTAYDLSIAVAILTASEQLSIDPNDYLFTGELALDGSVRSTKGVLSAVRLAKISGISEIFVPEANIQEASLVEGLTLYPLKSLRQLYRHLAKEEAVKPYSGSARKVKAQAKPAVDMQDIYGQNQAKRAIEVAAAGGHNILLSGPPGTGKTLLARALAGLLPAPSLEETIEIAELYSLAGLSAEAGYQRPFRNPHHTASDVALIGGGTWPKPGEISLSHRGVLFLDELPEFPRHVLEVLRQPLEDGVVSIARASGSITYPARFMLVATQNPCPCGYAGDAKRECVCSPAQVARYSKKVSGPLLDRVDLFVDVAPVEQESMIAKATAEPSKSVAERVHTARLIQAKRLKSANINAGMDNAQIKTHCQLDEEGRRLERQALSSLNLSARSYMRVLRVARTIADLSGSQNIQTCHLAEALQYRPKL